MGIAKEWLEGIGLSEQYPKFVEAGITHPKHFLTLDASQFESLGITTEDQKRKLLILCERVRNAERNSRKAFDETMSGIPQLNKSCPSKSVSTSKTTIAPVTAVKQPQEEEKNLQSSSSAARTKTPVVQGMDQPESWAAQIEALRDNNNAEHNLFSNQLSHDEAQYYDMRIKVIVRKRPMSKAEASRAGGIDIVHPLDCGEFGKILVYQPKTRVDLTKEVETVPFAYDNVYGEDSTKPIVKSTVAPCKI